MAYIEVSAFKKLRAFFWGLEKSHYNLDHLPFKDEQGMPIDKEFSLRLLHSLPDFQKEEFKEDNAIIEYLKKSENRSQILDNNFTREQQIELTQALEEKPIAEEEIVGQPSGQEAGSTGQETQPMGTPSSSTRGIPFGMPAAPSMPSMPRAPRIVIRNVPQAPKPDIAIARSSGVVLEKPTPGAKIITNREAVSEAGNPSKLVTTSGGVIQETPPSKIFIASSRGDIVREQPIKGPSRFSNFGSKIGRGIAGAAKSGLETANPFLGRMGNRLLSGLESIAKPGGIGGGAGGSRSVFSRLGRFGREGGTAGGGSLAGKAKGRGGLIFAGSIIGLMLLTGVLTITGTTPTGEAAPLPPGTTSGGAYGLNYTLPLKDPSIQPLDIRNQIIAQFPNAQINNWQTIIDQARAHGFNPAFILALWIEESGAQGASSYSDPLGCGVATPTTDINVSLNCLFNFDSQHNFTNDQFIDFMIIYAGGTPGQSLAGNDNFPKFPNVVKDWYSKLVPSGPGAITPVSSVPPPPTDGNYAGWVKTNFNIDVSALPASYQQWAYEILSTSAKADIAPKFKDLISRSLTKVVLTPGDEGSHTSGDTVYIRPGYDVNFFKQIFTHELGHRIKGSAGTTSPACNGQTIEQIESEGYLTYYAEHATPAQVRTPACGDNDQITRSDEDFGESVSYYINNGMGELNYGSGCSTYNSINPYARGDRPAHKSYIQCLLGP